MSKISIDFAQYIQKKDPAYKDEKEETAWSMEKFNDYVNEHYMTSKAIERDWALKILPVCLPHSKLF